MSDFLGALQNATSPRFTLEMTRLDLALLEATALWMANDIIIAEPRSTIA